MTFHIITIFPESFNSYINESILGRAQKKGKIRIRFYNPRDFTKDRHKKVDDRPYGGGPGMVISAKPIIKAVNKARRGKNKTKIIITSPSGKLFDNKMAANLAEKFKNIIIICGRYEGIDARVKKTLKAEEISVGPYILTGGELPAMIMIDSIARQIGGVLGKEESIEERRVSTSEVYTRPEVLKYQGKNYAVPKVLLGGDHQKIEAWKLKRSTMRKKVAFSKR